jgi:hypothetical protein
MAKAPSLDEADLERELLRKGVVALRAGHTRCTDCGRTPLVGEQLHFYPRGATVCELCRPMRAEPPNRSHIVRHSGQGVSVRRVAHAA